MTSKGGGALFERREGTSKRQHRRGGGQWESLGISTIIYVTMKDCILLVGVLGTEP